MPLQNPPLCSSTVGNRISNCLWIREHTFWPFSFVWGAEHRADLEDLVNLGIAREQRPKEIFLLTFITAIKDTLKGVEFHPFFIEYAD
jgi:hypothetical protein